MNAIVNDEDHLFDEMFISICDKKKQRLGNSLCIHSMHMREEKQSRSASEKG